MPVASCAATGTAPQATIRSLLAREGFPPQAPLPQRALSNGQSLLRLQEGLAVSHGTGRYARERIQCHGRWREKIRSLWMKHIWRRDARELNATEGGRRPLTGISSKDKGGYSPATPPFGKQKAPALSSAGGLGIKIERTAYRLAAYQSPARRRPVRTSNWGS